MTERRQKKGVTNNEIETSGKNKTKLEETTSYVEHSLSVYYVVLEIIVKLTNYLRAQFM